MSHILSMFMLSLLSFLLVGCDGKGQPSTESDFPGPEGGQIRIKVIQTPGSDNINVTVVSQSSSTANLAIEYNASTHLITWTDVFGAWTDPIPVEDSISSSSNFIDFLRGMATVGWYYARGATITSSDTIPLSRRDSARSPFSAKSSALAPPDSCPSYQFRGDGKCTVPLGIPICGTCDLTSACQEHDRCYFGIPDEACELKRGGNENIDKYTCDQQLGVNVSKMCDPLCGQLYSWATRYGGGRSWDPKTPCGSDGQRSAMGLNYCGRFGEASCCQSARADIKCSGIAFGYADCACTECWKVAPPQITIASTSCTNEGINPDGTTHYRAITRGTAEGPVQLSFELSGEFPFGFLGVTTCEDWSSSISSTGGGNCKRSPGQSASSTWVHDLTFDFLGSTKYDTRAQVFKGADRLAIEPTLVSCEVGTLKIQSATCTLTGIDAAGLRSYKIDIAGTASGRVGQAVTPMARVIFSFENLGVGSSQDQFASCTNWTAGVPSVFSCTRTQVNQSDTTDWSSHFLLTSAQTGFVTITADALPTPPDKPENTIVRVVTVNCQ